MSFTWGHLGKQVRDFSWLTIQLPDCWWGKLNGIRIVVTKFTNLFPDSIQSMVPDL